MIPDPNSLKVGIVIVIPQLTNAQIKEAIQKEKRESSEEDKFKVDNDDNGNIIAVLSIKQKAKKDDSGCSYFDNLKGKLKKIDYETDEITMKGIVIEEEFGFRTYINIDGKSLRAKMSIVDYSNIGSLLFKDSYLCIDYNSCGSAPFLEAVNIKKSS